MTPTPLGGQDIQASEIGRQFERYISLEGRHITGFNIVTAADSLDVTIEPGEAIVGDDDVRLVGDPDGAHGDADSSVTKTLPANDTSHIFLKRDGNIEVNQTGTQPANSIKLWQATTDGGGVTSTTDERDPLVNIQAPVEATDVEARDQLKGKRSLVKRTDGTAPERVWEDGSDTRKVRMKSGGALAVVDGSGTELTSDLGDISNPVPTSSISLISGESSVDDRDKTISNELATKWDDHADASAPHSGHEDTSNKGSADGYAGLDASSLVAQAAKLVQASAPGTTDGAIGVDGSDLKFGDGTTEQTAERQANKGSASGYAGLDGSSRVAQRVKRMATGDPGDGVSGELFLDTADDFVKYRNSAASLKKLAKDADLQAHIGDDGTDAHPTATAGGNAGFISGSDQSKLDGIESGAEVNQNAFDRVRADDGNIATADQEGDLLDIDGGTHMSTSVSADTLTVNHADAGLDGSPAVDATGAGVVISSLDATNGHIDGAQTKDLDSRYVQEGESNSISSGMIQGGVRVSILSTVLQDVGGSEFQNSAPGTPYALTGIQSQGQSADRDVQYPVPRSGTVRDLTVVPNQDVGLTSGESYTVTLMKNGSTTSLSVTIDSNNDGAGQGGTDSGTVSVSQGDRLSLAIEDGGDAIGTHDAGVSLAYES